NLPGRFILERALNGRLFTITRDSSILQNAGRGLILKQGQSLAAALREAAGRLMPQSDALSQSALSLAQGQSLAGAPVKEGETEKQKQMVANEMPLDVAEDEKASQKDEEAVETGRAGGIVSGGSLTRASEEETGELGNVECTLADESPDS